MKIFKKLVVAATAATMIFGTVSSAFAAVNVGGSAFADVDADDKAAEAFNVLAALGVYQGNEGIGGNVRPDSTITREEFSAVVVRFLDKESTAKSLNTYVPSFTDANSISSWAWGYVNVASSLGIVNGYPNGEFRPQNPVTHAEAIAMLTRAVNVDKAATGVWPLNYVVLGSTVGITDDVDIVANVPATRAEVAMLTYNAYDVEHEWSSDDEKLVKKGVAFGERELELQVEGIVNEVTNSKIKIGNDNYDWAANAYVVGVTNINDLVGVKVKAFVNSDDEVVAVAVDADEEVTEGILNTKRLDVDGHLVIDGTRYRDFASNVKLFVNNVQVTENDGKAIDADNIIDAIKAITSSADATRSLGADNFRADTRASVTLDKNDVTSIRLTVYNYDGVEMSNFDEDNETITVANKTISDKISVSKDTIIRINGKIASFDDLIKAHDDFYDEYEEDPLVYVATESKADVDEGFTTDAHAIDLYTEVVTGDAISYGRDGANYYLTVRVGGESKDITLNTKYDLDDDIKDPASLLGAVTLLLDAKGQAAKELQATSEADQFYAILNSFRSNDADEVTRITVKNANGDVVEINPMQLKDQPGDYLDNLDKVAKESFKRIGYFVMERNRLESAHVAVEPKGAANEYHVKDLKADTDINKDPLNDVVIVSTGSNTITVEYEDPADATKKIEERLYIANAGALVFDVEKDEQISVRDLRRGWTVNIGFDDRGDVGLIIVEKR